MEKLQSALETARQKRAMLGGGEHIGPGPVLPQDKKVDELWASLREIPVSEEHLKKHRVLTSDSGKQSVHFDILKTKILMQMQRHNWTRLAITSPNSACGKTTTAANIALSLGRQKDTRTILFDFDMRRPALHSVFGHRDAGTLPDLLSGDIPFSEQAVRIGDNVAIAFANQPIKDPSRYLLSDRIDHVLMEIEETYKPALMIFDLPPLLVSDDTRAFLKQADCALLVARAEHTTARQVELAQVEINDLSSSLGLVLNQCKHMAAIEEYEDYYE